MLVFFYFCIISNELDLFEATCSIIVGYEEKKA